MLRYSQCLIISFVFFVQIQYIKGQVFNSVEAMKVLVSTQSEVVKNLGNYLKKERRLLNLVQKHSSRVTNERAAGKDDVEHYLNNPLSRYILIDRLTQFSEIILTKIIRVNSGYTRNRMKVYPVLEDIQGATNGIIRLQETYRLNVSDLANGTLRGHFSEDEKYFVEHVTPMTTDDCLVIGMSPSPNDSYTLTAKVEWLKEALVKYREDPYYQFNKEDLCYLIAKNYLLMGDIKEHFHWTQKILALNPEGVSSNKRRYLEEIEYALDNGLIKDFQHTKPRSDRWKVKGCYEDMNYFPPKYLRCFHVVVPNMLTLVKYEILHKAPQVLLIHDFLRDFESHKLINIARKAKMESSAIVRKNGIHVQIDKTSGLRQAKMMDLNEKVPVVANIVRRMALYTNMSFAKACPMQVITYGIGGFYAEHYDYYDANLFSDQNSKPSTSGPPTARMATVLIFLSNIKQGGALVFNKLGLKVYPKKGTAVVFEVSYPSGDPNLEMMHTACPVIRGSKWIAIKWAREYDQSSCPVWNYKGQLMTDTKYKKLFMLTTRNHT